MFEVDPTLVLLRMKKLLFARTGVLGQPQLARSFILFNFFKSSMQELMQNLYSVSESNF